MGFKKEISDFYVNKTRCAGWLYLPDNVKNPPIIVMAHGFGAERTFKLDAFAERFANAGYSVFLFDYRTFGDSDGEPRNNINPFKHLRDWKCAIEHVRTLDNIDTKKIVLWGTSFSGGHVIVSAARDKKISGIIAQVPFVDGFATVNMLGYKFFLQATIAGIRDLFRIITCRKPYYVPITSDPDKFGFLNAPGCKDGYLAMVPKDSKWRNECPARTAFPTLFYRPVTFADKVECPALVICALKDELIPVKVVEKAAKKMKNAKFIQLPVGHFDVYFGNVFEDVIKLQIDFLNSLFKK